MPKFIGDPPTHDRVIAVLAELVRLKKLRDNGGPAALDPNSPVMIAYKAAKVAAWQKAEKVLEEWAAEHGDTSGEWQEVPVVTTLGMRSSARIVMARNGTIDEIWNALLVAAPRRE